MARATALSQSESSPEQGSTMIQDHPRGLMPRLRKFSRFIVPLHWRSRVPSRDASRRSQSSGWSGGPGEPWRDLDGAKSGSCRCLVRASNLESLGRVDTNRRRDKWIRSTVPPNHPKRRRGVVPARHICTIPSVRWGLEKRMSATTGQAAYPGSPRRRVLSYDCTTAGRYIQFIGMARLLFEWYHFNRIGPPVRAYEADLSRWASRLTSLDLGLNFLTGVQMSALVQLTHWIIGIWVGIT